MVPVTGEDPGKGRGRELSSDSARDGSGVCVCVSATACLKEVHSARVNDTLGGVCGLVIL